MTTPIRMDFEFMVLLGVKELEALGSVGVLQKFFPDGNNFVAYSFNLMLLLVDKNN